MLHCRSSRCRARCKSGPGSDRACRPTCIARPQPQRGTRRRRRPRSNTGWSSNRVPQSSRCPPHLPPSRPRRHPHRRLRARPAGCARRGHGAWRHRRSSSRQESTRPASPSTRTPRRTPLRHTRRRCSFSLLLLLDRLAGRLSARRFSKQDSARSSSAVARARTCEHSDTSWRLVRQLEKKSGAALLARYICGDRSTWSVARTHRARRVFLQMAGVTRSEGMSHTGCLLASSSAARRPHGQRRTRKRNGET
jgi:hypothetical protein